MRGMMRRFFSDESGATATEYAMLIIFIALAIAGGATLLGSNINNLFNAIGLTEIDASPETVTANGVNTARSILGRTISLNWQYHL